MAKKTRVAHSGKPQKFEPGAAVPAQKRPGMPKSTVNLKHKPSAPKFAGGETRKEGKR